VGTNISEKHAASFILHRRRQYFLQTLAPI